MGGWGEGIFENDSAGDWADELTRSDHCQKISDALTAVQSSPGLDECFQALVAAEVVAALRGWPMRGLYEPLKDWLQHSDYQSSAEEQRLALDAIATIRDRSDLADEIGQNKKQWVPHLQKLINRLQQEPKPRPAARPRHILPPEMMASINRLDLTNNSIKLTKGGSVNSLDLCDHDDATLSACLPFLTSAKRLWISNWNQEIQNTDAAFTSLDRFTRLEELCLSNSRITDATLSRIARLTKLKRLLLAYTPITDAGLPFLSRLINLEELDLSADGRGNSRLTGVGLACLCDMTRLHDLKLQGTGTDESVLALLVPMRRLCYLDLRNTKVTSANQARHFREIAADATPDTTEKPWFARGSGRAGSER